MSTATKCYTRFQILPYTAKSYETIKRKDRRKRRQFENPLNDSASDDYNPVSIEAVDTPVWGGECLSELSSLEPGSREDMPSVAGTSCA